MVKDENGKPIKGSCGDEIAYKLAKRDIVLHFRENPMISNEELFTWAKGKGHDLTDIADIIKHLSYARVFKKSKKQLIPAMAKVVDFFRKNPNPTDKQVHDWAEDHGYDPSDVEDIVYKLTSHHVKMHMKKSEDRTGPRKKYTDKVTITIKCNRAAADNMLPLIKQLQVMGSVGSSRSITIEDYDGKNRFGFDGDGPDYIESIELDGELMKSNMKRSIDAAVSHLQETGLHKKGHAMKVDPKELAMGIKVEMEHTSSKAVAREIALDHLYEDPKYYTNLKETHMEKSLMKGKAGIRGVPDGSGPEGKGPTGRQSPPQKPKRGDFDSDDAFFRALKRWQYSQKDAKKSRMEGKMEKSGLALVIFPGELTKAANLSGVGGVTHPAGLSAVQGKTKSKIPYTSHTERMALAKMAMERMLPKPEDEGEHANAPEVNRQGREKGEKPPYKDFAAGASGSGSQAHDNFGRETIVVSASDLGSSAPESASKYGGVKKVAKPRS